MMGMLSRLVEMLDLKVRICPLCNVTVLGAIADSEAVAVRDIVFSNFENKEISKYCFLELYLVVVSF